MSRDADNMVNDKFDRDQRIAERRWALITPGMQDDLRLATDGELFDYAVREAATKAEHERDDGVTFGAVVRSARAGDWIPFKYGIAVRLGKLIDPTDFE
jgi:hypothetical protein